MERGKVNKTVLLSLVFIISLVFLIMINQFLMPLFMAGLFSAMASPIHKWITKKIGGKENIASAITIICIILVVLIPLSFLVTIIVAQAIKVGQSVTPWVQTFIDEPTIMGKYLEGLPFYEEVLPYRDEIIEKLGLLVGGVTNFLVDSLSSVTAMTMHAVFGTIIMLYVMFYFFTMGDVLLNKILYFLPLHDRDEQKLLNRFTSVTRATIKGTLIIGLMQGTICGIGFAAVGIENPVFWGSVMAVTSVIPAFGTAIVWGPAVIIMALVGNFSGAVILLIICGGVAGNLDNVVRPRLVGKDTEMHDLFVLFGTLGGITMFGLLGIIIGPIIAALFITIWEIYGEAFEDFLPEVGIVGRVLKKKVEEEELVEEESDEQEG